LATNDRYRGVSDLPARLPVFPLRGAILLPRAVLPLQVFEPRYLAMLDDVMSGARMIGIIQPERSDDPSESPVTATALKPVGCAGRVTTYQELADGRLMIALTGVARFETTREQPTEKPYRQFAVDFHRFALDLESGAGEADLDRDKLLAALKKYLDHRKLRADWTAISAAPGEHLVNMLSIVSPFGPEEKQALLEAGTLKQRADILVALAEMELAAGDAGSGSRLQ
jgi:uncharacterized protein